MRPTAVLAEQGERVLVQLIEIRPLFPIHLDVDEVLVHQGGDRGILEALVRHDVAPMARRVADRQEDRLVAGSRLGERGGIPRLPVHRIGAVLQQVGAGRLGEAVAHVGHRSPAGSESGRRCGGRLVFASFDIYAERAWQTPQGRGAARRLAPCGSVMGRPVIEHTMARVRSDTIFAPATAPGRAALAIVRLSGPSAGDVCRRLTGRPPPAAAPGGAAPHARPAHPRGARSGLVLWFPAPASFTGEDVLELQVHGGRAVIAALLDALSAMPGLRPAEPGEFTRRHS